MSRRTEPMETYPSNTKTNPIPPLRPTQGRGAANPTASVPQGQTGRTVAQRNTGVPQRGQNARQSYKPPTRGRPVQNTGIAAVAAKLWKEGAKLRCIRRNGKPRNDRDNGGKSIPECEYRRRQSRGYE